MWTVESGKQDQDLDFKIGGKKMHKLLKSSNTMVHKYK